ncbi:MAG: hypothetical protein SFV24_15900 [Gemmatimonadales bacterium]|nr:hypothetical protein [Gemmatimonadales bacterium]
MTERDDDIRELFHGARRADTAWTPSFERVRAGRPRRPAPRGRLLAAAVVTMAAAVVLAVVVRSRAPQVPPELVHMEVGQLRMPSDFLLDVLGAETLRSVPAIGRSDDWFPALAETKGSQL